jgi:hypothetical protein
MPIDATKALLAVFSQPLTRQEAADHAAGRCQACRGYGRLLSFACRGPKATCMACDGTGWAR